MTRSFQRGHCFRPPAVLTGPRFHQRAFTGRGLTTAATRTGTAYTVPPALSRRISEKNIAAWTWRNLTPNTSYQAYVARVRRTANNQLLRDRLRGITHTIVPTGFRVTEVSSNTVSLAWDNVQATRYELQESAIDETGIWYTIANINRGDHALPPRFSTAKQHTGTGCGRLTKLTCLPRIASGSAPARTQAAGDARRHSAVQLSHRAALHGPG